MPAEVPPHQSPPMSTPAGVTDEPVKKKRKRTRRRKQKTTAVSEPAASVQQSNEPKTPAQMPVPEPRTSPKKSSDDDIHELSGSGTIHLN
jgi:hypothetical protein